MTPPRHPPPLRLADDPPPTPRRTLGELDDAAKATDARVVQMGSVVGTTAARVEVLTHDHDGTAEETLRQAKAVRLDVAEVAKAVESIWSEVGALRDAASLTRDEVRALGGSIADLQTALILRDVEAERRAKSIAVIAGKEASKASESRGAKLATASLGGLGAVLLAVVQLLRLLQGN